MNSDAYLARSHRILANDAYLARCKNRTPILQEPYKVFQDRRRKMLEKKTFGESEKNVGEKDFWRIILFFSPLKGALGSKQKIVHESVCWY